MRNQIKITHLLIEHLEKIMQTQGVIVLSPQNVKTFITEAIDICYKQDNKIKDEKGS